MHRLLCSGAVIFSLIYAFWYYCLIWFEHDRYISNTSIVLHCVKPTVKFSFYFYLVCALHICFIFHSILYKALKVCFIFCFNLTLWINAIPIIQFYPWFFVCMYSTWTSSSSSSFVVIKFNCFTLFGLLELCSSPFSISNQT